MATRKKSQAASELIDDSDDEQTVLSAPEPEQEVLPDDIAVMDLLAELGGDGGTVVRIYRQGKGGYRDLTLINEVSVADFAPMLLAHPPYGGGTFRIHARSKGGITMNRELRVEPAPVTLQAAQSQSTVTLEQVAHLITTSLAASLPKPVPGPTRAEMLEEIKLMAELFKQPPAPVVQQGGGLTEALSLATTIINMGKSLTPASLPIGEDGRTDTTGVILSKGMDMFMKAMDNARALPMAQPHPAQPALPAPTQTQPAPPDANPAAQAVQGDLTEEQADMITMVKIQLKMANRMAAAGDDPKTVAEDIYDAIPEDLFQNMAHNPEWFAVVVGLNADCAIHQAWYTAVRNAVLEIAKENGDLTALNGAADTSPGAEGVSTDKAPINGATGFPSPDSGGHA